MSRTALITNPLYPIGYKVNHYRQARRLLLATSQAAGPLWEFQWNTTGGHVCFVNRILVNGVQTGAATAEELQFNVKVARGFTSVDSSNVASILRSGDNQQINSAYSGSLLTAFVESNAATAASGGVYTQDTDPICNGSYVTLATASTSFDGADDTICDFNPFAEGLGPLRLKAGEGFIVNLGQTKGASQGFVLNLEVAWSECLKP